MNSAKSSDTKSTIQQQRSTDAETAAPRPFALGQRLGNQGLGYLLRARRLQAKLTVSNPTDVYEQEADRVADQVMRMADPQSPAKANVSVQRKCRSCEEELHRSPESSAVPSVDSATEQAISSLSGRGSPLSESMRAFMEPRFGADFSAVRVHMDANAHSLARAVEAKAFTIGNNVVFGAGHFAPESEDGKRLLAHELVHTIQQSGATARIARSPQTNDTIGFPNMGTQDTLPFSEKRSKEETLRFSDTGEIITHERLIRWASAQHRPVDQLMKVIKSSNLFSGSAEARERAAKALWHAISDKSIEERRNQDEAEYEQKQAAERKKREEAEAARKFKAERARRRRWLGGHGKLNDNVLQRARGPILSDGGVVLFETYDNQGALMWQSYPNVNAYLKSIGKQLVNVFHRGDDLHHDVDEHIALDKKAVAETLEEALWIQRPALLLLPGVKLGYSEEALEHGATARQYGLRARDAAGAALEAWKRRRDVAAGERLNEARVLLFKARHSLQAMLRTREADEETTLAVLEGYSTAGDVATIPMSPVGGLVASTVKSAAVRGAKMHTDGTKFGVGSFLRETAINIASMPLERFLGGAKPGVARELLAGVVTNQIAKVAQTGDLSQLLKIDLRDLLFTAGGTAYGRVAQARAAEHASTEPQDAAPAQHAPTAASTETTRDNPKIPNESPAALPKQGATQYTTTSHRTGDSSDGHNRQTGSGDSSSERPRPSTPLATRLPMTPAHRRLLDRLASGVDRTLPPPDQGVFALSEHGEYSRRSDPDSAYDAYNEAYAGSAGREVGLYHNPYTGEYSVRIGSRNSVSPPAADGWEAIVHNHPDADIRLPLRLPSPKDMEVMMARSGHADRVFQFIEFDVPGAGRGRVEFGVDRAHLKEPLYVTIRPADGPPKTVRFTSIDDFASYRDRDTYYADGPLALDLMRDLNAHRLRMEHSRARDGHASVDNAAIGGAGGSRPPLDKTSEPTDDSSDRDGGGSGSRHVNPNAVIEIAVAEARRAFSEQLFETRRWIYPKSRGSRYDVPDHLNCQALSGACGFGSERVAESLLRQGVPSKDIHVNQAAAISQVELRHQFVVYTRPDGVDMLLDTTFAQFTGGGNAELEALFNSDAGRRLSHDLLTNGYTVLTDDVAHLYLRLVSEGRQLDPVSVADYKRDRANLASHHEQLLPDSATPKTIKGPAPDDAANARTWSVQQLQVRGTRYMVGDVVHWRIAGVSRDGYPFTKLREMKDLVTALADASDAGAKSVRIEGSFVPLEHVWKLRLFVEKLGGTLREIDVGIVIDMPLPRGTDGPAR